MPEDFRAQVERAQLAKDLRVEQLVLLGRVAGSIDEASEAEERDYWQSLDTLGPELPDGSYHGDLPLDELDR